MRHKTPVHNLRRLAVFLALPLALTTMAAAPRAAGVVDKVPADVDLARLARPITGLPVANGVLKNAKQHGAAGVIADVLWPSEAMNRQLHVGSSIPTLTVGWTRTDASGSYTIEVDPALVPASYIEPDGRINLDFVGWTDAQVGRMGSPVDLGGAEQIAAEPSATHAGKPIHLDVIADRPNIALRTVAGPQKVHSDSESTDAITPLSTSCTWNVKSEYNANASIGRTWSYGNDKGWMKSGSSQSMTLGYAVSTTGLYGSWSARGRTTASSGVSFEWAESIVYREFFVSQHWGRYQLMDCSGNWQNNWYSKVMYSNGGYSDANASGKPTFPAANCFANSAGLWQRDQTDGYAYKMSGGVKTAAALGVNLYDESNYSTTHVLKYRLIATGKVCGTNAAPAKASEVSTSR